MRIGLARSALAALLASSLTTAGARAESVGGTLLVGHGFDEGYNFGLGIRGGAATRPGAYVGGTVMTHLGRDGVKTEQFERPQTDLYYAGAEGGWEFAWGPLVARPYLGAAYGWVRSSTTTGCPTCDSASSNDGAFALFPGFVALAKLGIVVVGADVRYVMLFGTDYANAIGAFGTAGLSF